MLACSFLVEASSEVAGNQDSHKSSNAIDFGHSQTADFGVTKLAMQNCSLI